MEAIAFKSIGPNGTPDPITGKDLQALNTSSADPADKDNLEFVFPAGFIRWTLLIVPRHVGGGTPPDPTVDVKYWTGKDYVSTNPATSATAVKNKANAITREDSVTKVLVNIINGATTVDGGVDVTLYGTRVTQ